MRTRHLIGIVVVLVMFIPTLSGEASTAPQGNNNHFQSSSVVRATVVLYDAPVLDIYWQVLYQTGNPAHATHLSLVQLDRILEAQQSLIRRLNSMNITIIRRNYLTANELLIRVEESKIEAIRNFPEVKELSIETLTEYQMTMEDIIENDEPADATDGFEFPAPGNPPGR